MPVDFLPDAQVAAYAQFTEPPPRSALERFFFLDNDDLELIGKRRGDHNRLGFALQATTVRYLGAFLTEDPIDVPWPVVEFLAAQLGIGDASCVKRYTERPKTAYEHSWEIRRAYGYTELGDDPAKAASFRQFLTGRAWTRTEGPIALFEQAVAWLRRNRVLLPGISVLTRLVSEVRQDAATRQHTLLQQSALGYNPALPDKMRALLAVPPGARISQLEALRRGPTRASGPQGSAAFTRVETIAALHARSVDVSAVPANRLVMMARYGFASKAPTLADLAEPRRTATLLAMVRELEAIAVDDTLDLLALLMVTKLINPARRRAEAERLAAMPRREHASKTLARAQRILLRMLADAEACGAPVDPSAAWKALERVGSREQLTQAAATVEELVPDPDNDPAEAAAREQLTARYATVRPFLPQLGAALWLRAAPGGKKVLAAVRTLPALCARRVKSDPLLPSQIDRELVSRLWYRAVFANPQAPEGAVHRDAYVLCVLERLHHALRVRDVFAVPSHRYGDPRAQLLDGSAWSGIRERVLAGLNLVDNPLDALRPQVATLHAAWIQMRTRLAEAGDDARAPGHQRGRAHEAERDPPWRPGRAGEPGSPAPLGARDAAPHRPSRPAARGQLLDRVPAGVSQPRGAPPAARRPRPVDRGPARRRSLQHRADPGHRRSRGIDGVTPVPRRSELSAR